MGTMKVVAPVLDIGKRPHTWIVLFTLAVFVAVSQMPSVKHALALCGIAIVLFALPFVGNKTTRAVRYLERINALVLLLFLCEVATS